jgi:hypothetical protein
MARPQPHRPLPLSLLRACAPLALAAALAFAPAAVLAQAPIEQQMTPEAFKAAGLDKLSPQELANLNAWLNNTLQVETSKAATVAKEQAIKEEKERNFANFGNKEPVIATLVGEFHGFGKGRRYTLDNGQVWEQSDEAELPGVHKTNPKVRIKPTIVGNAAYLTIEGYFTSAKVRRIK